VSAHLRVLRHTSFRNLWIGQTASGLGDRLVVVALALFVTDLIGSATDVGLVLGAQTLPLVVFLLIGGVWADRLPRARVMIATDVVRGALHGLLAILIFTGVVEVWHSSSSRCCSGRQRPSSSPRTPGWCRARCPGRRSRRRRRCRS